MSEITTAARRITRDVNANPNTLQTAYDVDGRAIQTWPADMEPTSSADGVACTFTGRRGSHWGPITQREVQDLLDAHAWALTMNSTRWAHSDLLWAYREMDARTAEDLAQLVETPAEIAERDAWDQTEVK